MNGIRSRVRGSVLGLVVLAVVACGGGTAPTPPPAPPPPPPPPPPPAPVASVVVTPATNSILVGQTVQLAAQPRDAQGNNLNGRAVSWSSAPQAVATVSTTGLVTTVGPGTATVTATSEGIAGTAMVEAVDPLNIPFFEKPFGGEFPTGNFLDHDIPKQFVDNNGVFTTFWGEVHSNTGGMTDGHSGYDFNMPVGTPLLAMAPGTVVRVDESSASFFCPPLNMTVDNQKSVFIEHTLPGGVKLWAWYVHNSVNLVTVGQAVTTGQQVALAGNTGCSSQSHLHLEIYRSIPGRLLTLDPFGWSPTTPDPWAQHPDGTPSIKLWKPGKAPALGRETVNDFNASAACCAAVISRIVFEGVNDAANPNNEFIEIALDSRAAASVSLNGYRIKGDVKLFDWPFPAGITLDATRPSVRVYSGAGTNTASTLYMGRTTEAWSNLRNDCARLVSPGGGQYRWSIGSSCPLPGPGAETGPALNTRIEPPPLFEVHAPTPRVVERR